MSVSEDKFLDVLWRQIDFYMAEEESLSAKQNVYYELRCGVRHIIDLYIEYLNKVKEEKDNGNTT